MIADIFSVKGEVARATGATPDLGHEMALTLVENGALIAPFDRDPCPDLGPNTPAHQACAASKTEVEATANLAALVAQSCTAGASK